MCDLEGIGVPSIFKLICSAGDLEGMLPTLDLISEGSTCDGSGSWVLASTNWFLAVEVEVFVYY